MGNRELDGIARSAELHPIHFLVSIASVSGELSHPDL